jgi:hypothetical protein
MISENSSQAAKILERQIIGGQIKRHQAFYLVDPHYLITR